MRFANQVVWKDRTDLYEMVVMPKGHFAFITITPDLEVDRKVKLRLEIEVLREMAADLQEVIKVMSGESR